MRHHARKYSSIWLLPLALILMSSAAYAQSNDAFNRQAMVAQGDGSERYPLGVDATLSNSVGIGSFIAGYGQVPSFSTSLTLMPHYDVPRFLGMPKMILSATGSLSWWWADSYFTSAFNQRNRLLYSDVSLNLNAPNALEFESIGLSISPSINISVPISKMSRTLNRVLGAGISGNVHWAKDQFSVSWMPAFSAWIYGGPSLTMPCGETGSAKPLPPVINPQNANFDLEQYMQTLVVSREEERNSDGTCNIAGRQTLGMLSNIASVSWSPGAHGVSLALGWYINFLRPLADRPDLKGIGATGQGFSEATMGRIAYSYTIPVDFNLVVSGGVLSYQAAYDKQGRLSFPFFDFVTPGRNQTQFFIQLTAGI
jgi:hypothetical protein